jgi:CubicO group peptidase (beta-lactamase class C family)
MVLVAWTKCFVVKCLLVGCLAVQVMAQSNNYFPQQRWRFSTPEAQGMDSAPLAEMFDYVAKNRVNVHSIQIVRHGYVVLDAYFYPFPHHSLHDVASVTKSVTSGVVGIAVNGGFLKSVNQPVLEFFPDRQFANVDARKRAMTLEHLLTMASGLDCGYQRGEPELAAMLRTNGFIQYVLDLPMREEPGRRFAYCSGNFHLLSAVLTKATKQSEVDFARQRLFEPLGIRDADWSADREGITHGWGDLHLKPLDMARIGYLYLQGGRWNGRQIIAEDWIDRSTHLQTKPARGDGYGYGWWISNSLPGLYEALGRGGQRISVLKEKDMVVVFTGGEFEPGNLAPFLLGALKSDRPLPDNPAAYQRLQNRVAAAAKPPSPSKIEFWSPVAAKVSGKEYRLDTNSLALNSVRLQFRKKGRGEIALSLPNRRIVVPIGFDGVYRMGTDSATKFPIGGKGVWRSENELDIELNFIAKINRYNLNLRFEGNQVVLQIKEATGLTNESVTGIALK